MHRLRNRLSRTFETLFAAVLVSFASSARADFDDTEVLALFVTLLGWPAVIATSAFVVGSRRPVIIMLLAAILYPFSAYCLYFIAHLLTEGLSPSYRGEMPFTLVLLLAFWISALVYLKRWGVAGARG